MKQKVAILIVNFRGLEDTLECLDSLQGLDKDTDFEIFVANYLDLHAEKKLNQHAIKPLVKTYDRNLGFAGFNNQLIGLAREKGHKYFVLLNNDTTVAADFLKPLLARISNKPTLVSPKIYFFPGKEFHHDSYTKEDRGMVLWYAGGAIDWRNMLAFHRGVDEVDRGHFNQPQLTDFATGCCLAFSWEVVEKIGLMDEKYFMYFEDVDWSLRAKKTGIEVFYEPRSVIWHKNASSSGGSGSEFQKFYQERNRLILARRFASLRTTIAVYRKALSSSDVIIRQALASSLLPWVTKW